MNRALLAPLQLHRQFIRMVGRRQAIRKDAIYKSVGNGQRFGEVVYYKPDKHEEPKELPPPPKLFRVQRICRLKGMIYWERKIINNLGLTYSIADVAVVKNTPENCEMLWRVKHLVSVEPITYTYGEPTTDDINHTHLKENGECVVHKKLEIPEERVLATKSFVNDPVRLDKDTLKHDALMHWNSGR